MEEWKVLEGTDKKIMVSNMGRIRSLLRDDRILKLSDDCKGYKRVKVTINGNAKSIKVHRAVAIAFINNPNNYPQVNHKDGNKHNNCVENLEWVTNKENANHAIKNGLWESVIKGCSVSNQKRMKKLLAKKDDSVIKFDSISEAERHFKSRHICDVLKGKRSHVKGWRFEYLEGGDADDHRIEQTK